MIRVGALPLFWQVVLTNGLVFVTGTALLALSPATVSSRVLPSEAVVLAVGLLVIAALNAVLLRSLLTPLDRLAAAMAVTDLRRPRTRLEDSGRGPAAELVAGFNRMLDRLEEERRANRVSALTAQEAERQRVAQELHDEVGQSLTVVLLGLTQAIDKAPADVWSVLLPVQESARSSLEEVRRISQRLRPGVLEDLGLVNSLSSLASDFTRHSGVPVSRTFSPGLPTLPSDAELVVYRVAQEALTNIGRHARASRVEMGLSRLGQALVLRVRDDGVGFRPGRAEGSGIQGMRERAELVGGSFEIAGAEGRGTEVRLVVPLDPPRVPTDVPAEPG